MGDHERVRGEVVAWRFNYCNVERMVWLKEPPRAPMFNDIEPLVRQSDYIDVHGDLQRAVELVERQNGTLSDAADQIEQLSAALDTALESLDQIGAMTKKGRAALHARATATFIRSMEGYANG